MKYVFVCNYITHGIQTVFILALCTLILHEESLHSNAIPLDLGNQRIICRKENGENDYN